MLPLSLLKAAVGQPMLIELKNGDTYNGRLVSCNVFMNICLKDVICTSKNGDRFWKMPECYIRGIGIKYMRIPDEVVELVAEEEQKDRNNAFRGGRGGRGAGGRLGSGRGGFHDQQEGGREGGRGYAGRGGGYQGRGEGGRGGYQGRGYAGRGEGRGGRGDGRGYAGRGEGRGGGRWSSESSGRGRDGGRGGRF